MRFSGKTDAANLEGHAGMNLEFVGTLGGSVLAGVVGFFGLKARRDPQRNTLTRFLVWSASTGEPYVKADTSLLVSSIVSYLVAIVGALRVFLM
jgi:hypothetical protein